MLQIKKVAQLTGHNGSIYALASDEDSRYVFSGAGDGWVVRWDLEQPDVGKLVAKVETNIFAMCPILEQRKMVVGNMNGGVHWIDLDQPDQTKNIAHHKKGVFAILRLGKYVFTVGGGGLLTRWSIEQRRTIESLQLSFEALRSLDYSSTRNEFAIGASDNNIYLVDADTFAIKHTIENAHENSVFAVRYHPTHSHLLSGSRDAHLKVWDLENGFECVKSNPAHWFTINDIVFHPKGDLFATASRDKTIKVWRSDDYQLVKVIEGYRDHGHFNSVNCLFWSEHQHYLLSASDDRTINSWEIRYSI